MRNLSSLAAFRRRPIAAIAQIAAEDRIVVAPPPPSNAPSRLDVELVDVLEADILRAIGAVGQSIGTASAEVAAAEGDLASIRSEMDELAASARGAATRTLGLAASTEELAGTSGDITRAMDVAHIRVREAVACASDANGLIAELARATDEIAGIVDAIAGVARQTNLLALNATIEAARAGAAGRGFAVVASEVKSLSVETGNAANDIRRRIGRLRASADSSIAAVESVMSVINEVQPIFATVRSAVDEQDASITELAERAVEASTYVEQVSECAGLAEAAARDAGDRVAGASRAAEAAETLAKGLGRRLVAGMRQIETGDRRRSDRFPTELKVEARGFRTPVRTVDVSLGGVLLARHDELSPGIGMALDLKIGAVGAVAARVVALSDLGTHCVFEALDPDTRERIGALVHALEEEYQPLIDVAQQGARSVRELVEQAVTTGRLSRGDLFDTSYRLVEGSQPQQFETAYLPVFEEIMPEILEPLLARDSRMVFCNAVDRNGYTPAHNRRFSQPQRAGDVLWNSANCRNKRIFEDRAGITAARSTRSFTVQSYLRDMGGGTSVIVREVDAPIRLFGRHWGGFRTAYRL